MIMSAAVSTTCKASRLLDVRFAFGEQHKPGAHLQGAHRYHHGPSHAHRAHVVLRAQAMMSKLLLY